MERTKERERERVGNGNNSVNVTAAVVVVVEVASVTKLGNFEQYLRHPFLQKYPKYVAIIIFLQLWGLF